MIKDARVSDLLIGSEEQEGLKRLLVGRQLVLGPSISNFRFTCWEEGWETVCARRSVVGHTPLGIHHSAHGILSRNKTTLVYLRCAIHVDTKVHWRLTETRDSGQR